MINELGNKHGRLLVVSKAPTNSKGGKVRWECLCDCGKLIVVVGTHLRKGTTVSCGCAKRKLPAGEAAFRHLVSQMRRDAKKHGRRWLLSEKEVRTLTQENCFYCGAKPTNGIDYPRFTNGAYIYNGIDRVDNEGDYQYENCLPCCAKCNYAKRFRDVEEFLHWANVVASRHPKQLWI